MRWSRIAGFSAMVLVALAAIVGWVWYAPDDIAAEDAKTPAELLVGTWSLTGMDLGDGWGTMPWHSFNRLQFHDNGKWTVRNNSNRFKIPMLTRTAFYTVEGNVIHMRAASEPDDLSLPGRKHVGDETHWDGLIESITRTELIVSVPQGKQKSKYRRVR